MFIYLCIYLFVTMLKTFKFASSILFETHIVPDGSSRILKLPLNLSKLLKIDSNIVLVCINQDINQ